MREIKFRAWNGEVMSKPFYLHEIYQCEGLVGHFTDKDGVSVIWPTMEEDGGCLLQYTGLKDKNGAEIYEGDVVYWEYRHPIKADLSEHKTYSGKFAVVIPDFYYALESEETTYRDGDDLEVVGNIHENPGFLDVKA